MPDKDPTSTNDLLEESLSIVEDELPDEIDLGETEQLIWAAIDGYLVAPDIRRLETLLTTDEEARKKYIDSAMLHAELTTLFREADTPTADQVQTPVLGALLPNDLSGIDVLPVKME